ncbi:MAG: hypothetical protein KOO69_07040 [Victivallales bacterium]|nr:hypothetical protein [Victivallales bacterium]
MSLLDLLRPHWQNHDPKVRLASIKKLDDMSVLVKLAQHDQSKEVRNEALNHINDDSLLEQIVLHNNFHETALNALKKIKHQDIIFLISVNAKELAIRNAAIELIENEIFLAEILKSCDCLSTCLSATERITDIDLLKEVHVHNGHNPQITLAINDRIKQLTKDKLKKL